MRTGRARPSRGESENPHKLREDGRPLSPAGGAPPPPSPPAVPPSLSLRREDVGQGPPAPMPPPQPGLCHHPPLIMKHSRRGGLSPRTPRGPGDSSARLWSPPEGPWGTCPMGETLLFPLTAVCVLCMSGLGRSLPTGVYRTCCPWSPPPCSPSPPTPLGLSISLHLSPCLCLPLSPPTLPPIQGVSPILNHMWEPGLHTGRLAELSLGEQTSSP